MPSRLHRNARHDALDRMLNKTGNDFRIFRATPVLHQTFICSTRRGDKGPKKRDSGGLGWIKVKAPQRVLYLGTKLGIVGLVIDLILCQYLCR